MLFIAKKNEHTGIRGVSNQGFKSYLNNHKQYVSLNDTKFDTKKPSNIQTSALQSSVLGSMFFFI